MCPGTLLHDTKCVYKQKVIYVLPLNCICERLLNLLRKKYWKIKIDDITNNMNAKCLVTIHFLSFLFLLNTWVKFQNFRNPELK